LHESSNVRMHGRQSNHGTLSPWFWLTTSGLGISHPY